jgi:hypothetical protein
VSPLKCPAHLALALSSIRLSFLHLQLPQVRAGRTRAHKKACYNMILAQKQTWRPVEQNRRPRYESTLLCPLEFWQRSPK